MGADAKVVRPDFAGSARGRVTTTTAIATVLKDGVELVLKDALAASGVELVAWSTISRALDLAKARACFFAPVLS